MIKLQLIGVKEIDAVFNGLPLQVQDKQLRVAEVKAVVPLVNRAHYLAPVGKTGNLAESIGVVTAKHELFGNKSELGIINVGPRRKGKYKGFHGHLNEFGTETRHTKSGADKGIMKPKPFMEPAWEATKGEVEENISVDLGKGVYRFMKRTIKNNGV
jgi:HK97 gp10 family phage protein